MTALDDTRDLQPVDAAFHYTGLLLRALGYLAVWAVAQRYDFGQALLTGALVGDLAGQVLRIASRWRDEPLVQGAELLLLAVVYLFVRSMLVWPDEPAMRAIVGLAAFGALSGHVGSTVLTRLGPTPA